MGEARPPSRAAQARRAGLPHDHEFCTIGPQKMGKLLSSISLTDMLAIEYAQVCFIWRGGRACQLTAMTLAGLQHYLLALAKLIGSGFSLESPAQCTLGESFN